MTEVLIEARRSAEGVLLSIAESFDSTNLGRAEETITKVLDQHREGVTLNLYECEYIDEAALGRLVEMGQTLREQGRNFDVYVRPMSFVAFRTQTLPLVAPVPTEISKQGERNLAERRTQRLEKWRKEKPIPKFMLPHGQTPPSEAGVEESGRPLGQGVPGGERETFDIDYQRVASLAGKDERVIERIWTTYTKFLNEGKFKTAPDGSADTQMTLDSNLIAKTLRLDPKVVRRVIESVSTHLMEVFDSE